MTEESSWKFRDRSYDRGRNKDTDDRRRSRSSRVKLDIEMEIGDIPGIEVRKEGAITAEIQNILWGSVKRWK